MFRIACFRWGVLTWKGSPSPPETGVPFSAKAQTVKIVQPAVEALMDNLSVGDAVKIEASLEKATQGGATQAVVEPTSGTERIGYNNGFGDFFFGKPDRHDKRVMKIALHMFEEEKNDRLGITGSNGVPVVELDNFQRY